MSASEAEQETPADLVRRLIGILPDPNCGSSLCQLDGALVAVFESEGEVAKGLEQDIFRVEVGAE